MYLKTNTHLYRFECPWFSTLNMGYNYGSYKTFRFYKHVQNCLKIKLKTWCACLNAL